MDSKTISVIEVNDHEEPDIKFIEAAFSHIREKLEKKEFFEAVTVSEALTSYLTGFEYVILDDSIRLHPWRVYSAGSEVSKGTERLQEPIPNDGMDAKTFFDSENVMKGVPSCGYWEVVDGKRRHVTREEIERELPRG